MKQVRWSGFLRQMLNNNSFCDSDKYSLVFCFNQIMGVMPDKVKEMMDRGEEKFMVEELNMITPETESPAFVRRKYLQSLYRFFKVYPSRSMFRNPFEEKQRLMPGYLFFAEKSLAATALGSQCCEVARFLMKRKRMKEASVLLDNFVETQRDDYQYIVTKAHALRLIGEKSYYGFASVLYKKALEMKADDEHVISGLARSLFATQDYEKSYELYEQLLEKHPEKKSFMLNSAACLVNMKRYEEALKIAANRHDISVINVYDPRERTLPNVGLVHVRDAETGRDRWINTGSATVRRNYETWNREAAENMLSTLRRYRIDTVTIGTGEDYVKQLIAFFKNRA
jgi:tetratricopeptide (TPR) repeat protein